MTPEPYRLRFVQVDRSVTPVGNVKHVHDDPDYTYVYTFFAESSKYACRIKYVVRLESYDDCFALKYYCSRSKHSLNKYSRVLNFFNAVETKRIMEVCASIIPLVLEKHKGASFAFNGSRTHDKGDYIEGESETQRYRIYCELVRRLFGETVFYISRYDEKSSCLFINRKANPDISDAENRIRGRFSLIFDL